MPLKCQQNVLVNLEIGTIKIVCNQLSKDTSKKINDKHPHNNINMMRMRIKSTQQQQQQILTARDNRIR